MYRQTVAPGSTNGTGRAGAAARDDRVNGGETVTG
jgi:hypothetical protein